MDLEEKLDQVPDRPGVYLYKDAKAQVIYVGKAASLRSRVRSYFQESRARDAKTDALVGQIRDLEYIVTANELEALILESNLVKKHRPRYNIILRDDKHYPFLKLTTNEEFPRLVVARRVQKDGATLLRPVLPGHRDARDAAPGAPAVPPPHLPHQDRRHAGAAVPPVLHPPLQRAVHGMGDARGLRPDGQGRASASSRARDDDLRGALTARDGDRGARREVRAGRRSCATRSRR